jgi:hypothetical protein
MAHLTPAGWQPSAESQKNAVLKQLERLLGHGAFRNSKRGQALLRYVVEHQLQNPGSHLKERTIGTDVFGRDAGYDTNADAVVRVVAGEIRRRLAQYYHEAGHEGEIRIELPMGTYAPEFHLPPASTNGHDLEAESPVDGTSKKAPPELFGRRWLLYASLGLLLSIAGLSGMVGWHMGQEKAPAAVALDRAASPLDQFWSRLLASPGPVQLVIGTRSLESDGLSQHDSTSLIQAQVPTYFPDVVGWRYLVAASGLIGLLQKSKKAFFLEDARTTTISNLAQSPAILIGGLNNPWITTLGDSLQFRLVRKGHESWIADRKHPNQQYVLSRGVIPGSIRDYGIIARLTDKVTGQVLIIVAGIGAPATMAASDFITNARDMETLIKRLPKGWESKNLEALISVEDMRGEPGASRVVAVDAW